MYYQQLHLKNFRGASKIFELILSIFAFVGMIVGFAFLIYYGYKVTWWAPVIIFIIGLLFMFVAVFLEKMIGTLTMSLLGFIVWPICAYLMFTTIPI